MGPPVYDWKIVDRIFDVFRQKGVTPLVEAGFMPEALSIHPQPYRHNFPKGSVFTGWTYPARDYARGEEREVRAANRIAETGSRADSADLVGA